MRLPSDQKLKVTYNDEMETTDFITIAEITGKWRLKGEEDIWIEGFLRNLDEQGYAYSNFGKYEVVQKSIPTLLKEHFDKIGKEAFLAEWEEVEKQCEGMPKVYVEDIIPNVNVFAKNEINILLIACNNDKERFVDSTMYGHALCHVIEKLEKLKKL